MTTPWQRHNKAARRRDKNLRRRLKAYVAGTGKLPIVNKPTSSTAKICNDYGVPASMVIPDRQQKEDLISEVMPQTKADRSARRKAQMRAQYAHNRRALHQTYSPRSEQKDESVMDKIAIQILKAQVTRKVVES